MCQAKHIEQEAPIELHGISYSNMEIAEGDKLGLSVDAPILGATIQLPSTLQTQFSLKA